MPKMKKYSAAAKIANAHDFIAEIAMMGYDTNIGDSG